MPRSKRDSLSTRENPRLVKTRGTSFGRGGLLGTGVLVACLRSYVREGELKQWVEKRETRDLIIIRAQAAAGQPAMIRRTTPEDNRYPLFSPLPLSLLLFQPLAPETLSIPVLRNVPAPESVERKLAAVGDRNSGVPLQRECRMFAKSRGFVERHRINYTGLRSLCLLDFTSRGKM